MSGEIPAADANKQDTIEIQRCYCCDGHHESVPIYPIRAGSRSPWTHWYRCPTLGDPVFLCIKMIDGSHTELNHQVISNLAMAQSKGPFMVSVFWMDENKVTHCENTTSAWPYANFEASVRALSNCLAKEIGHPVGTSAAEVTMSAPPSVEQISEAVAKRPNIEDLKEG